ncbi:EpsG family protein [Tenacibaculum aiptasiae]|uniref:EpsG family protein n=1 Tax=Tenacibaculum aiptasiae TaxID=426481 RepID=UPI00232CDF3C|nr:EpsG family protein [Tenacibaculum aiptasiae]
MSDVLIVIYIFFAIGHLSLYLNKKKSYLFTFFTLIFIFFLMSGHEYVGNGDGGDFYGYWYGYTEYENLERNDFWFYYLFYSAERIGIYLSLNFYQWWAVMTALSLTFIIWTIKKRRYNPHLFFFFFMIYYVFVLYVGLKFFYGFCLFQYALTFLLRGEKRDKFKFILLTLLAGGFHVMYYIFLVLVLVNLKIKKRKYLIKGIIIFSVTIVIFNVLSGRGLLNSLQSTIDSMDNTRLSTYFAIRTNWGFMLAIGIHVLTTIYAFRYRAIVRKYDQEKWYFYARTLLYVNLFAVIFYPLFMIALTFMRILTSLSLTTIIASSYKQEYFNKTDRLKLLFSGFLIICLYFYINMYLAGYIESAVLPFFDSYYFK